MKTEMTSKEKKYVEKVAKDYGEKEETKLDKLRLLDHKTRKGASIFAYVFGTIGALILGFGMSVAMEVILANSMPLGIAIGVVGLIIVSVNYFIYQKLLESSKRKHASEILELSKDLLNEEKGGENND